MKSDIIKLGVYLDIQNEHWRVGELADHKGKIYLDIKGKKDPGEEHLLSIASEHGIHTSIAKEVIEQVLTALSDWPKLAKQFRINRTMGKEIRQTLEKIRGATHVSLTRRI